MTSIRLDNWRTTRDSSDPFKAPETCPTILTGIAYGHPRYEDGRRVWTSRLVKCEGRLVTTSSGSVYRLGFIDPEFRAWLKAQGIPYDPRQPIKVAERKPVPEALDCLAQVVLPEGNGCPW